MSLTQNFRIPDSHHMYVELGKVFQFFVIGQAESVGNVQYSERLGQDKREEQKLVAEISMHQ